MSALRGSLVALLCFAPWPVLAETTPAERLAELLQPIETLSAEFAQTVVNERGRVLEESHGRLDLARPMRFRWEVRSPHEQLVVTADERVYIHDRDLAQVNVEPLEEALAGTPALVLAGSIEQVDAQFVVEAREVDGAEIFALRPRAADALFRELRLTFDEAGRLTRLDILDALDQRTEVVLSELRVNEPIDEARFSFVIPPDTDVIGDAAAPLE